MPTVSNVTVVGHLSHDIEERKDRNGNPMCFVSVWTKYPNRDDKDNPHFTTYRGAVFGLEAKWLAESASKGSLVSLCGSIQGIDRYTPDSGEERLSIAMERITSIRCLERREGGQQQRQEGKPSVPPPVDPDDDLNSPPF